MESTPCGTSRFLVAKVGTDQEQLTKCCHEVYIAEASQVSLVCNLCPLTVPIPLSKTLTYFAISVKCKFKQPMFHAELYMQYRNCLHRESSSIISLTHVIKILLMTYQLPSLPSKQHLRQRHQLTLAFPQSCQ